MQDLFFKDWDKVLDVAICSVVAFIALFLFIRISGKRTLSKLNAFDFIVAVSLGSTLSSMMLAKVTIAEGSVALIIIIALQFLLAWLAVRSEKLEKVINSKPTLLYYEGVFLTDKMNEEYITKDEILAEIRRFRIDRLEMVKAVVLELNGEMSVIKTSSASGPSSTDEFFRSGDQVNN